MGNPQNRNAKRGQAAGFSDNSPAQMTVAGRALRSTQRIYQRHAPSIKNGLQRSMPGPSRPPVPPHYPHRPQAAHNKHVQRRSLNSRWMLLSALGLAAIAFLFVAAFSLYLLVAYSSGILPGVHVGGIELGGLSIEEAESRLNTQWRSITVRDGERVWKVPAADLGIRLNVAQSVQAAYGAGRGEGNLAAALFGQLDLSPVIEADPESLRSGLHNLAVSVNIPARNAGITLIDGTVQTSPAEPGRLLDVETNTQRILQNPDALTEGVLELSMLSMAPAVTDATPMLAEAQRLLASPLIIRVYDPVTGDFVNWSQQPDQWARWLQADADPNSSSGLRLSLDDASLKAFLINQSRVFDESRYLKIDEASAQIRAAVAANNLRPAIRVYHHDRIHSVQAGETIVSIAWDYGVPYPWVQQANPGVDTLRIGQNLTIPSPDTFMPFEVIPDKRIVVSISEQRVRVYEDQNLKWDWPASTGINSSPTWPGIYQIISHEPNAYAANWNLWMPNFMGVYHPIPGSEFTNGFHGFPTRGGGQILWENSLGTRVTYGCILLSNTNEQLLYDWAQEGVVVEIQP